MAILDCPKCKSENTELYSTRQYADWINRYIKCKDCGAGCRP